MHIYAGPAQVPLGRRRIYAYLRRSRPLLACFSNGFPMVYVYGQQACCLRDSGAPGPPLLLPRVALFLAAPTAILYAICAILVFLDLLSSSRRWLCSLLLPQPFCTLFARFWCLRWPLETHFELFWVLLTKWLSDGLWRLILSYSEVCWPNGSQMASGGSF